MKRYVCTVATGLLLALVSTGSATAGLPLLGNSQHGTQSTSFGDQTVGEQKNDADVTQEQGNGNINVAPAIAIFGDASSSNAQGNGNTAKADVDQGNKTDQSQTATQSQDLAQDKNSCCGGQSQTGQQTTTFGDQTVGEQKNYADVEQKQGNGNINIAPALALGGAARTTNYQGNGNSARANVDQSNEATQSQSASQRQGNSHNGGGCCKPPTTGCGPSPRGGLNAHSGKTAPCKKQERPGKVDCCHGQSQTGQQTTTFGDQTVGEQKNDADVTQKQGNDNVNFSPAIALGGKQQDSCRSKCDKRGGSGFGGNASAWNAQGNGNYAKADVNQSNSASQSQEARQQQSLVRECKEVIGL